jgi:hypothetical protein
VAASTSQILGWRDFETSDLVLVISRDFNQVVIGDLQVGLYPPENGT